MSLKLFIPITKVDEEKRLVYGIATAEAPDRSGEICDYETTKPYYEKWSSEFAKATDGKSLGNLRTMHGKVAAGKITDIMFNDSQKQIEICAKVVDDNEWKKVIEGVYTGFSQGGSYVKRWNDETDPTLKRYTASPTEVSLVDLPCLPTATFEVIKSDGGKEMRKFSTVEKTFDDDKHPRDDHGRFTSGGGSSSGGAGKSEAKRSAVHQALHSVGKAISAVAHSEVTHAVVEAAVGYFIEEAIGSAVSDTITGSLKKTGFEVSDHVATAIEHGVKAAMRSGSGKVGRSALDSLSDTATKMMKAAADGDSKLVSLLPTIINSVLDTFQEKFASESTLSDSTKKAAADTIASAREKLQGLVSSLGKSVGDSSMDIKNEDIVAKATELAKAAGDETRWPAHIVEARALLEKALETPPAPPAPTSAATPEAPAASVEKAAEAGQSTEQSTTETTATDEVEQVWLAKDGSPHKKKADAIAKNRELETQNFIKSALSPLEAALAKASPPAQPLAKAEKIAELRKYLGQEVWDAQRAINALGYIMDLLSGELAEEEQDAGQISDLRDACNSLKSFIVAEIQEDGSDGAVDAASEDDDDVMAMSAKLGTLAKKGARNSAADKKHLQAIHDHAAAMGADCSGHSDDSSGDDGDADKSAATGDLAKVTGERDALMKSITDLVPRVEELAKTVQDQAAELQKLRDAPIPTQRPVLRAVAKGQDVMFAQGEAPMSELTDAFAKLSQEQKAELLVKLAQSQPLNVINR